MQNDVNETGNAGRSVTGGLPQSDMVERVARAIWDDACPGLEWGEIDKLTYTGWARAAIEAMREPTDKMICASLDDYDKRNGRQSITECWNSMIDAALAGEK